MAQRISLAIPGPGGRREPLGPDRDWNDPRYRYSTNSRQRILETPDSLPVLEALKAFYCTPSKSPVLKMALRYLEAHEPTPEQIAYIRSHPTEHRDCHESSWSGKQDEMEIVRRFAAKWDIRHREVLRLALRMLAEENGIPVPHN